MKAALFIFILAVSAICHAQSSGGGGGADRPSPRFISFSHICKDGEQAMFTEARANDRTVQVLRTCENGRYYPKAAPVILRCRDGQRVKMHDLDSKTFRS